MKYTKMNFYAFLNTGEKDREHHGILHIQRHVSQKKELILRDVYKSERELYTKIHRMNEAEGKETEGNGVEKSRNSGEIIWILFMNK